jgi:hypothetical protein
MHAILRASEARHQRLLVPIGHGPGNIVVFPFLGFLEEIEGESIVTLMAN